MRRILLLLFLALLAHRVSASFITSNEPLFGSYITPTSYDQPSTNAYKATCLAHGTLSASQIHNEVFESLNNPNNTYTGSYQNGPLWAQEFPGGGGEVGQEQESPVGDCILPLLLMAIGYTIILIRRKHKQGQTL